MPLVTQFKKNETKVGKLQPTQVIADYKVIDALDGKKIFQIDTGGSATRANPGKQSQTFQLDEKSAAQLWRLLGETFKLKA